MSYYYYFFINRPHKPIEQKVITNKTLKHTSLLRRTAYALLSYIIITKDQSIK